MIIHTHHVAGDAADTASYYFSADTGDQVRFFSRQNAASSPSTLIEIVVDASLHLKTINTILDTELSKSQILLNKNGASPTTDQETPCR